MDSPKYDLSNSAELFHSSLEDLYTNLENEDEVKVLLEDDDPEDYFLAIRYGEEIATIRMLGDFAWLEGGDGAKEFLKEIVY